MSNPCCIPSIESIPSSLDASELFGYTTNGLNFPGVLALVFNQATSLAGFSITGQSSLALISFPNLVSITGAAAPFTIQTDLALTSVYVPLLASTSGAITWSANPLLLSASFPALTSAGFTITFAGCPLLTSLSMPLLVTGGTGASGFSCAGCTNLANVTLTNYVPTNTRNQNFTACALTQTSVDHILARCVANAAYVSGSVLLAGGTNAVPGTQGQLDKATLIARGVNVQTN